MHPKLVKFLFVLHVIIDNARALNHATLHFSAHGCKTFSATHKSLAVLNGSGILIRLVRQSQIVQSVQCIALKQSMEGTSVNFGWGCAAKVLKLWPKPEK